MRIEVCDSTGEDMQFVVYAETDAERVLLNIFTKKNMNPALMFWMHGSSYVSGSKGCESFNFGFIKKISVQLKKEGIMAKKGKGKGGKKGSY